MSWRQFFGKEQTLVLKSGVFYKHVANPIKQTQNFLGLPYRKLDF